jgi:hypothetical protein
MNAFRSGHWRDRTDDQVLCKHSEEDWMNQFRPELTDKTYSGSNAAEICFFGAMKSTNFVYNNLIQFCL